MSEEQNTEEQQPDEWRRDEGGRFGPGNKGGPGRKVGTKIPSLKALERAILDTLTDEGLDPAAPWMHWHKRLCRWQRMGTQVLEGDRIGSMDL